jgi:EpsI family protein
VAYEDGGVRVTLFQAGYSEQADGKEVISYDNRIEGHGGWRLTDDGLLDVAALGRWRRAVLLNPDGRHRIVLYRYAVAGRRTASRLEAKLWQGLSGVAGDRSASILAVSATCRDSCEGAEGNLVRFLTDMVPGGESEVTSEPGHP